MADNKLENTEKNSNFFIVTPFFRLIMGLMRKWQFGVPAVVESKEEKMKRLREEKNKVCFAKITCLVLILSKITNFHCPPKTKKNESFFRELGIQ